ncbi:MAG: hypothetical protein IK013_07655 [Bacteroidales bacterium]|nr:hypothetical protein [Bacteroidales bacterium]
MIKSWIRYVVVFVSLMGCFLVFAILSCCMPDRAVQTHIGRAALTLHEKGEYPNVIIDVESCRLDNFTDALILNQIFCIDRSRPLHSAMVVTHAETQPVYDFTGALVKLTRYEQGLTCKPYARYWHGSTFLFRYLLTFMSYSNLLWLMIAISAMLWILFIVNYYPRAGIWNTLAFMFSWLMVYGFVMPFSLQFFPVLALSLIASTLIVKHENNPTYIAMLFFVIACFTCYFDLLTTPLLTFGWPLTIWISIQKNTSLKLKDSLCRITGWGALWVVGYGLTFLTKWGLGSLILKANVLKDATGQVLHRMASEDFSRWDAIVRNFNMLPISMMVAILILLFVLTMWHFRANGGTKALLLLLTALMPYVWYLSVSNHSYLHYWFTYRLQAITIAALYMALLSFSTGRTRPKKNVFLHS